MRVGCGRARVADEDIAGLFRFLGGSEQLTQSIIQYSSQPHHNLLVMLYIQNWLIEAAPTAYYLTAALGSLYLLNFLFILLRGALRVLLHRKLNLVQRYGEKSWALVTGSSDGIGKEFALQLAKEGFNVILLARTEAKLQAVRQEILRLYPAVKVEIVVADLGQEGRKERAEDLLPQLSAFRDISMVVNNAGVDVLDNFTNLAPSALLELLYLNCCALAALNHRFIPLFQQRFRRTGKRSAIINVGSVAGETPLALHNAYSASKAYVNLLTDNLSREQPNIDFLALKPAHVTTAMTCYKDDFFCVSTKQCVEGALKDLGHVVLTNGALWHKVQSFVYSCVPRWLFNLVWMNVIAKQNIEERRLASKRKAD